MSAPPWRSGGTNGNNRNGAFHSVNSRKTLSSRPIHHEGTQTLTQTPTPEQTPKTQFPDKLKDYVARTFEDCPPDEKVAVELELKRIITDAFNEKVVWSLEWDKMPLPQTILARKKVTAKEEQTKPLAMNRVSNETEASPASPFIRKPNYSNVMDVDYPGKKRKSAGSSEELTPPTPDRFEERFDKRPRQGDKFLPTSGKLSQREKDKRAKRFEDERREYLPDSATPEVPDNKKPLIGRCMDLEKRYFRLTSAPNPDHVRPLHVLEKTLEMLKRKWRSEANYSYICDQFKSLRQDLTVQHIKNDFVVTVYEIHARIALEKGDLGEYNQCQTQLHSLYREGFKGHEEEFKAYRILYLIHTCNRADMNELLANLTPADKEVKAIKHALEVRSVLAAGNFHRFFRLYLEAPAMGGYLMDSFVARERKAAMCMICKGYRPDIDIRFLTEELGFESDTDCVNFLCDNEAADLIEQKSGDKGVPNSIRFQTAKALPLFERAKKAAFSKVDIKGQL
ncbi:SAC3/GANP/Nin1/mts3/eIF-3 p25 family-domain-containing protein [Tuber brumale]|nr:SAC3/GANP/Nin1/mts3/eIF-3 p25 family-domain-containing protein [Tuber brumale]